MRGFRPARYFALMAMVWLAGPGPALADDLIPDRRLVLSENTDLPGGDLTSIFDTTLEACERACLTNRACTAFTFNTRNGSCFPKSGAGGPATYQGAYSGTVIEGDAAAEAPVSRVWRKISSTAPSSVISSTRSTWIAGPCGAFGSAGVRSLTMRCRVSPRDATTRTTPWPRSSASKAASPRTITRRRPGSQPVHGAPSPGASYTLRSWSPPRRRGLLQSSGVIWGLWGTSAEPEGASTFSGSC